MWLQPQLLLLTTVAILANCKNKNNFIKLDSFQRSLLQNEKELARKISQRSIVAAADKASQSERVGKQGFITIELKKKSILLGEVIAILSAYLFPHIGCSGGLLRSDIVVSKIGIFVLFVIKGLSISPGEAEKAWADWRINLFTQMFSSIAVPLLIWGIVSPSVPDRGFRDGLICLSALPCALNTAVSLAAAAGANTPTALTNGLLGWLLSIAVMPATVAWLLREDSMSSDAITCNIRLIAVTIGKFVILPCVLGQMARRIPQLKNFISKHTDLRSTFSDMILLALVQQSFSDTFLHKGSIDKLSLAYCIVLMPLVYLISNALFWTVGKKLLRDVDIRARSAATICACQKSISFGLPFIRAAFGHREDLAEIVAPLLVYNTVQLVLGSNVVVPILKHNIHRDEVHQLVSHGCIDREESTTVYEGVAVAFMKLLLDVKKFVLHGRLRTLLSSLSFFCVFVELYEELLSDVPGFANLTGKIGMQHGMFFLSMSHLLHHIHDFVGNLGDREDSESEGERLKIIAKQLAATVHSSEEAAARAFDSAARLMFGPGAPQNFNNKEPSPDETIKISKYRGVVWDASKNGWKVDPASVGIS